MFTDSQSVRRSTAILVAVGAAMPALAGCGVGPGATGPMCGPSDARVERVIDGDTVELEDGSRVRYLLVDAPEVARSPQGEGECFGAEAAQLNGVLVAGRQVRLEYDAVCRDPYDRLLAYLHIDQRMVNSVLVERGYARVVVIGDNKRHADLLADLQAQARDHGAGLWGQCLGGESRVETGQGRVAP